ncbi:MAG TPA: type I methionyl aminopeptidase [Candidatus Pacearchaeota archaeon]|nr:type I methionyl aminopeptidase [Candidatus Pacearchaeota archaeon]HOK94303.1 type I methionyl aminopeptidase [Candidatus Pacearchaeota archaeon]HPO75341.1 type I methionyl aminopeptidase [Candidatus Pacearchaeota archaeon]
MLTLKSPGEIEVMAEGGKLLAGIMKKLEEKVKAGVPTKFFDELAEELIFKCGGEPNFKGEGGFPATICTSVNEEIVHGIPSERILREGDILSLDIGMKYKGYHSDMAVTVPVGKVSSEAQRLIRVTKKALKRGIKKARIGNTLGDIGNTIQRYVESQGFNVVRELCGHGIGKELHEDPQVLNYGKRHKGLKIQEGMVFCIEPMVTIGDWRIKRSKDGQGFETKDGSLSCHFEHEIAITQKGPRILTKE